MVKNYACTHKKAPFVAKAKHELSEKEHPLLRCSALEYPAEESNVD
jgi:hypothetical protein